MKRTILLTCSSVFSVGAYIISMLAFNTGTFLSLVFALSAFAGSYLSCKLVSFIVSFNDENWTRFGR
jgi:hypothetical protein